MTRAELVDLLLAERFGPLPSPPPAIHHTPPVAAPIAVVDELAARRRLRDQSKPVRHTLRGAGRFTVRRRVS